MDPILSSALATIDYIQFFVEPTLRGDIPDEARCYQTQPETAHITWLVGHVAFAMDRIGMPALQGATGLPDSLQTPFGRGAKPAAEPDLYPTWEETTGYLTQAIERLRARVKEMTPAELGRPLPTGHPFEKMVTTQAGMVAFIGLHTCYHLGQVSLLRRAQGLPSGIAG